MCFKVIPDFLVNSNSSLPPLLHDFFASGHKPIKQCFFGCNRTSGSMCYYYSTTVYSSCNTYISSGTAISTHLATLQYRSNTYIDLILVCLINFCTNVPVVLTPWIIHKAAEIVIAGTDIFFP